MERDGSREIDTIRSVDTNHVIIVESAFGEAVRDEFPSVRGENLMYEFHFYPPLFYAAQTWVGEGRPAWGVYPDTEVAIPPEELEYSHSAENSPLPAGASPWRYYEGDLVQVTDDTVVAGNAYFSSGPNPGFAFFDDFVIDEFDADRRFVEVRP